MTGDVADMVGNSTELRHAYGRTIVEQVAQNQEFSHPTELHLVGSIDCARSHTRHGRVGVSTSTRSCGTLGALSVGSGVGSCWRNGSLSRYEGNK